MSVPSVDSRDTGPQSRGPHCVHPLVCVPHSVCGRAVATLLSRYPCQSLRAVPGAARVRTRHGWATCYFCVHRSAEPRAGRPPAGLQFVHIPAPTLLFCFPGFFHQKPPEGREVCVSVVLTGISLLLKGAERLSRADRRLCARAVGVLPGPYPIRSAGASSPTQAPSPPSRLPLDAQRGLWLSWSLIRPFPCCCLCGSRPEVSSVLASGSCGFSSHVALFGALGVDCVCREVRVQPRCLAGGCPVSRTVCGKGCVSASPPEPQPGSRPSLAAVLVRNARTEGWVLGDT